MFIFNNYIRSGFVLKSFNVFQVYIPQVLELIEISPVNSELQLAALRLLTNLSVTDKHQHLLKGSIKLLLSLLVVSNETLQVGFLSVLLFSLILPCVS